MSSAIYYIFNAEVALGSICWDQFQLQFNAAACRKKALISFCFRNHKHNVIYLLKNICNNYIIFSSILLLSFFTIFEI